MRKESVVDELFIYYEGPLLADWTLKMDDDGFGLFQIPESKEDEQPKSDFEVLDFEEQGGVVKMVLFSDDIETNKVNSSGCVLEDVGTVRVLFVETDDTDETWQCVGWEMTSDGCPVLMDGIEEPMEFIDLHVLSRMDFEKLKWWTDGISCLERSSHEIFEGSQLFLYVDQICRED